METDPPCGLVKVWVCAQLKFGFSFQVLAASLKFLGPWFEISNEITKLTTGQLVNGSSCDGIDMVIKNLDLKPKVYAMMRDFLDLFRWKELSKESGSKILLCSDGSYWKTFKPIVSLIAKGKLK
ncbi:hypothetical protein Tco_1215203 [Tanacetum coccineum]